MKLESLQHQVLHMPTIKLTKNDTEYLSCNFPNLLYDNEENVITGIISFNLKYKFVDAEPITDEYQLEIDLNKISSYGLPRVRETGGKILNIAKCKKLFWGDLHLNSEDGEMCIILPPKAKEKYPNGFDLQIFLEHIQEHLYWVSYYEKYDKKPWKEYGHGDLGYLELYIENKERYSLNVREYFGNLPEVDFLQKIKMLREYYKI